MEKCFLNCFQNATVKDFSVKTEKGPLLAEHLAWAVFQGGYNTWGSVRVTVVAGTVTAGMVDTHLPLPALLRREVHAGTKTWLSGQASLLPKAQLGKGAQRNFNSPCDVSYPGFIFGILAYVSKFIKLMSTMCRGRALHTKGTEMLIFQRVDKMWCIKLVPNRKKNTSRLYIVTLLI